MLVLLLRLRQVCSHPCLIQEGGFAFAEPAELADTDDREPELTRARQLVSLDFVHRMREKFKQVAAERMAAEQKVGKSLVDPNVLWVTTFLSSLRMPHSRTKNVPSALTTIQMQY